MALIDSDILISFLKDKIQNDASSHIRAYQSVIDFIDENSKEEVEHKCPCCGSDKTYITEAIHCNICAVTSEL